MGFRVDPVEVIVTETEVEKKLTFTLDAGQVRYVRLNISMGFWVGRVYGSSSTRARPSRRSRARGTLARRRHPDAFGPASLRDGPTLLSLLVLIGCGKHYWGKAGASPDDFTRDSGECARENALYRGGTKEFGTVLQDQYKDCLRSRGWQRAQKYDPPPPGWYRGIEGDETVRLNPPASQPPPTTR